MIKATQVTKALRDQLEQIRSANGYYTDLKAVYGPQDKPSERPPLPYALVRWASDVRTDLAVTQALRARSFEIEVFFSKACDEEDLDAVHVDILRCLGIGQDQPDRKFPGLLEGEDEAIPRWASNGETTHSITITVGVQYAQTYN